MVPAYTLLPLRRKALLDLPLPLDDLDGSLCTLLDDVGVTRYLGNISDTRHMYEVKQKVFPLPFPQTIYRVG